MVKEHLNHQAKNERTPLLENGMLGKPLLPQKSVVCHLCGAVSTTGSTKTRTTLDFARLLVVFTTTHLFFDPTSFHKLAETTNGILNGFFLTKG